MKRLLSSVAVSIALLLPAALLAWGPEGHEVVAALAQSLLSDTAKSGVQSLIGNSTLASVSNWADQVRSQRDETYNWHFVDIPKSAAGFSDDRDCFLPNWRFTRLLVLGPAHSGRCVQNEQVLWGNLWGCL
jgi:hypothetical protein